MEIGSCAKFQIIYLKPQNEKITADLVGFIGKLPGLDPNFAESVVIVQRSKAIRLGDPAVAVSWRVKD